MIADIPITTLRTIVSKPVMDLIYGKPTVLGRLRAGGDVTPGTYGLQVNVALVRKMLNVVYRTRPGTRPALQTLRCPTEGCGVRYLAK